MDFLVALLTVVLSAALGLAGARGTLQLMFAAMSHAPIASRRVRSIGRGMGR